MFSFLKRSKAPIKVQVSGTRPNVFFDAYVNDRCVMRMQCVRDDQQLLIGDIAPFPSDAKNRYNKGYGSRLMEELLAYSKENEISKITGNLATVDLDHKDRLHHFYEKFGFSITEYDSPKGSYYGEIFKSVEEGL